MCLNNSFSSRSIIQVVIREDKENKTQANKQRNKINSSFQKCFKKIFSAKVFKYKPQMGETVVKQQYDCACSLLLPSCQHSFSQSTALSHCHCRLLEENTVLRQRRVSEKAASNSALQCSEVL